jgi:hypothetical protein
LNAGKTMNKKFPREEDNKTSNITLSKNTIKPKYKKPSKSMKTELHSWKALNDKVLHNNTP